MKRSILSLTVAAAVGAGSLFASLPEKSEAASISKMKEQQQQLHEKRSGINSSINEADQKIQVIKGQQTDVKQEMERIDLSISDTNSKIQDRTAKLAKTKEQIASLKKEIKVIQIRIKKRNDLLKDRARSYQENGGMVNYLDVLMGSTSFSDFIDRANAVATIMEADQEILKEAEADKQELENKQNQVKKDLENLQAIVSELQSLKQQLSSQKAEKEKLLGQLQAQEKKLDSDVLDLQEQAQIIAAQEAVIQKAINLEKARQAELARQRQAAASSSSEGTSSGGPTPAISSGFFTRPAAGVITSTYGGRWGAFHYGVDIASQGSNIPILAAADGVVFTSHYSTSYGNVVYITHSYNGHIYTTVYAHMRRSLVTDGQVVTKGQQIGVMGYTGDVVPKGPGGQHLHFELYDGPWRYHGAINPMGIVPL